MSLRTFGLSPRASFRVGLTVACAAGAVTSTLLLTNAFAATSANGDTISALLSQYGVTATPIASAFTPATSEAQAVAVAHKYVAAGKSSASTEMLVEFTDPAYGAASAGGSVTPTVANRPVWLVIQPNVEFPVSGPPGYDGPASYTATAVSVVDAETGEFIEGMSVG